MNSRILSLTLGIGLAATCVSVGGSEEIPPEAILLVKGTTSVTNPSERNYAQSVARRLERWLDELAIAHRTVTDEEMSSRTATARLVILGYNPYPSAAQLAALRSFTERGGRLIVFYSSDANLAGLMGFKLGDYQSTTTLGRWSAMRFAESAGSGFPRVVLQESRNIRTVQPARKDAFVLAHWQSANGTVLGDSAVAVSRNGFWVTHVFLDDGDTDNKKQMLLAMVGGCLPSVWHLAAQRMALEAFGIGRFDGLEDATKSILQRAKGRANEARVRILLGETSRLSAFVRRSLATGEYKAAIEQSRSLRQLLTEAYVSTFDAGPVSRAGPSLYSGEFRGVWDHPGTGLYPGDWGRTCRILADSGMTDVFVNVMWAGSAHYRSEVLPASATLRQYGDQLQQCVDAARSTGIRVHAWKVCWRLDGASPGWVQRLERDGRLQVSDTGQTVPWLCPSHPDNLQTEVAGIREVVRKYPVSGIHLDYIRYQDSHYCYCRGCRTRFERKYGLSVRNWPEDVRAGSLRAAYNRWRCEQITELVRTTASAVRSIRAEVRLSAAVYGKYPSCVDSVGQDWPRWLSAGYLDFACPMNYTTDLNGFRSYLESQAVLSGGTGRIFPGIGVTATESRLDAVRVVDQISAARDSGFGGFVLFDLNRILEREILPMLRLGATAR